MSVSAVSSVDVVEESLAREPSTIENLAQAIQSVWNRIYAGTVGSVFRIVHVVRDRIKTFIRDAFFFPLKWAPLSNRPFIRDLILKEELYSKNFWDQTQPPDLNLNRHEIIRERFSPRELVLPIELQNGKQVNVTCCVIESKSGQGDFYNFVQVANVYTTISNNIGSIHPYLDAYLANEEKRGGLPPARFIMISEYNLNNYKPETLEEAGLILLETLHALQREFGELDQLVAHSLGNVFLASALRQVSDPKKLPRKICLDRGPSSIWEASKKYFFGLGRLLYPLAKWSGWSSDLQEDIVSFCQKWEDHPPLLVTGVVSDHYFSGEANLCLGQRIRAVDGVDILVFDPPLQIAHEMAHHSLRANFFNCCNLVEGVCFMDPLENLPEAIIRTSLEEMRQYAMCVVQREISKQPEESNF